MLGRKQGPAATPTYSARRPPPDARAPACGRRTVRCGRAAAGPLIHLGKTDTRHTFDPGTVRPPCRIELKAQHNAWYSAPAITLGG
ncbi:MULTISPECIES: hypothetical protein [unclassified Streptomyces]|uniref:hypothetical protein n=1 Tax=unclassified Streptomyces TaxID=2593676 RepID=UPI001660367D|nr:MULTISPECIES: hypothetical protein [unclassified Streptomyces]